MVAFQDGLPGVDADDAGNRDNGISGATERYS